MIERYANLFSNSRLGRGHLDAFIGWPVDLTYPPSAMIAIVRSTPNVTIANPAFSAPHPA